MVDMEKTNDFSLVIEEVSGKLAEMVSGDSINGLKNCRYITMPSVEVLDEVLSLIRAVLFPGYLGFTELQNGTLKYHIGATLDKISRLLSEQIKRGFLFNFPQQNELNKLESTSLETTRRFIDRLPHIKSILATDVVSAYLGDPAAKSHGEVIFCYPSITAITYYRIAHELYQLGVPLIPRIITEKAHSLTGIDIHPGAEIGPHFFMDHGTGIVIGETAVIGRNVRLYQGVTLGAKSFPSDEKGNPAKGIPRHPIVEDDVIIYSGATILGRVTIGKGSIIGGNVWITYDVPPNSRIVQGKSKAVYFNDGAGI